MYQFANILGPDLLIVLVLAAVLIFGANKLPKLARNVGEASKEFKKAQQEAEEEDRAAAAKAEAVKPPTPIAVPSDDDKITLSKSELDALLVEREARIRKEAAAARDAETPPAN